MNPPCGASCCMLGTPGHPRIVPGEHFHGFLQISACPSDDFPTFFCGQNVIKHTSFKMLQTYRFSSILRRASSQNIYGILRMLSLMMFLALGLHYSTSPAAFLLQSLHPLLQLYWYSGCYTRVAILVLLLAVLVCIPAALLLLLHFPAAPLLMYDSCCYSVIV